MTEEVSPNPKSYASSKRRQRYSDKTDTHKAHPNAQRQRKIVGYNDNSSAETFSISKYIRTGNNNDGTLNRWNRNNGKLHGATEFEKVMGCHMTTGLDYSMNKHRLWECVDEMIVAANADEIVETEYGKESRVCSESFDASNDRRFLAYYDLDTLSDDMRMIERNRQRFNVNHNLGDLNNINPISNDSNRYVKDSFWDAMYQRMERKKIKQWRLAAIAKPKEIKSDRLNFSKMCARTTARGCKLKHARVDCLGRNSFWQPVTPNCNSDYIEIDLGSNKWIEAVSTKGRPIRSEMRNRDNSEIEMITNGPTEYVKRYKLFVRFDDGTLTNTKRDKSSHSHFQTCHKSKKNDRRRRQNNKKTDDDDSHSPKEWLFLGIFNGNTNCDDEVYHRITLPNNGKAGVTARLLRFQPLALADKGFIGHKSMRIGVYGHKPLIETKSEPTDAVPTESPSNVAKPNSKAIRKAGKRSKTNETTANESNETMKEETKTDIADVSTSTDGNIDLQMAIADLSTNNSDTLCNTDNAAAIICIRRRNPKAYRSQYCNRMKEAMIACDCRMCSNSNQTYTSDHIRQRRLLKNRLRNDVKRFRSVNEFTQYSETVLV